MRIVHAQADALVDRALHRACMIGLTEFLALLTCSTAPDGEMRMNELAEAVGLTQGSASRLVVRLERAGLTERRICEYDRRGVYTALTVHGYEVLHRALPVFEDALRETLDRLGHDPRHGRLLEAVRSAFVGLAGDSARR
jgi:DNA-binding MarR family transcriptional regulator